ncbi:MAG: hypothetical protein WD737_06340 [Gemmatimonadota bacterium]
MNRTNMNLRTCALLVTPLAVSAACAGDGGGESAAAQALATSAASNPSPSAAPADTLVLDCVAQELYTGLAAYIVDFQELVLTRPVRDSYETDEEYSPREDAWVATVPGSVDVLVEVHEPVIIRNEVRDFAYDPATQTLTISDFGDYAVPGVIVDPSVEYPYPAFHCQVGPFFACATSPSIDAWRRDVVGHQIPLGTGEDASVEVAAATAAEAGLGDGPLEFEAEFVLVRSPDDNLLLPTIALRSIEFLSGGTAVARWEGEAESAGRTTQQRMMSFEPQEFGECQ